MNEETLVDSLNGQFPDGVCNVELPDPDSCSGFVTSNMEGFIVASAILLKFRDRRDIVIMLLFPKRDAPKIALAKKELSISGGKIEAQVFLTANEGIEYSGTITGTGFKKAELILTRRPNCQLIQQRYSQVLAEKKDQGTFGSSWMPVSRAFDDILVVFRPSEIHDYDLEKIFRLIGAEDDAFRGQKNSSFIIGDGRGTSYTLSLVLDRSLRREMMDETIITLT